jgi:hypothetical protein
MDCVWNETKIAISRIDKYCGTARMFYDVRRVSGRGVMRGEMISEQKR